MKILRNIDISQATALMEKVNSMQQELDIEKKKLKDLLINLNLEYYGSSPSDYYNSLLKEYATEDGFYVKLSSGYIIISKKMKDNLTVTFRNRFDNSTEFSVYRCEFVYDSGKRINWLHKKQEIMDKNSDIVSRFEEIIQSEKVYDPFTDFSKYISFVDFQK